MAATAQVRLFLRLPGIDARQEGSRPLLNQGAREILAQVKRWLAGMKLTLNEDKTCIREARKESFRFLGYELGPVVNHWTGSRYLGALPSKKAMERIRQRVSETLRRGRTEPWTEIRDALNRLLRGWSQYFSYGSPGQAFRRVDNHVAQRARNFLRKRHKLPAGTSRFRHHEIFSRCGILNLTRLLKPHARA